jgi:heme o synthase
MSLSLVSTTSKIDKNVKIFSSSKSFIENLSEFKIILSELTKFKITFFVTLTTSIGYLLFEPKINFQLILTSVGVLVLASGASSLNEYQERNLDFKMKRTKSRPIPSGRISPNFALIISSLLILLGSVILYFVKSEVMFIGIFTLLWYNGIYTPLKSKSAFAIIPGALVGALPPIIGWIAAGGNILDKEIIILSSFLFIWQIPHFWLLLLMYDDQYKEAGFPTLSKLFSENQILKITYTWIIILVISSLLLINVDLSNGIISNFILITFGIIALLYSLKILFKKRRDVFRKSFLMINLYALCVLLLITIENFI